MTWLRAALARHGRWLGWAIVLVACGFALERIIATRAWTVAAEAGPQLWVATGVGAVVIGLASFLLAIAWTLSLRWAGGPAVPAPICIGIYVRSLLAKYLPGNLFSLVARHILARRAGVPHGALVWAAGLELLLQLVAATLVALPGGLSRLGPALGGARPAFVVGVIAAVPMTLLLLRLTPAWRRLQKLQLQHRPWRYLVAALLSHLGFFLVCGTVLWALVQAAASADRQLPFLDTVAVAAAAWILGFVTPGASAGLGVREAVLIALLTPTAGAGPAALVSILYRVVTVLGDCFAFVLSLAIRSQPEPPRPLGTNGLPERPAGMLPKSTQIHRAAPW